MSGADKQRWNIAPGKEEFTAELLNLRATFPTSGDVIYQARNVLKRMVWHGQAVIVKSFAKPNAIKRLIYGKLRKSKAMKSFEKAVHLQTLGICTPTPIGFIEHHYEKRLTESFYVCLEWRSRMTVREPLCDPTFVDRSDILQHLGVFAWQLHQQGVLHPDFSPGNILVAKSQDPAKSADWSFCLVDVNRVRFGKCSLPARMRNFAMLWASDADLELMIKAYARASGDNSAQALRMALEYSRRHKRRAMQKENIKTLLRLH